MKCLKTLREILQGKLKTWQWVLAKIVDAECTFEHGRDFEAFFVTEFWQGLPVAAVRAAAYS